MWNYAADYCDTRILCILLLSINFEDKSKYITIGHECTIILMHTDTCYILIVNWNQIFGLPAEAVNIWLL